MRIPFFRRQPADPPRYLIVGLGNPGAEYQNTRHNVGFRAVDLLAERHRIDTRKTQKRAFVGHGRIGDMPVALAKPITFMNLSGESIAALLRAFDLQPAEVIVVTDDVDLSTGRLRVRPSGSAGGHNGLKSVIEHLRTEDFPRIRIGVGRPKGERAMIDHVLSKFERTELEPIAQAIESAADAVETILSEGVEAAMNRFNRSIKE